MMKENYEIRFLRHEDISAAVDIVRSSFEKAYLIPSVYRGSGIEKFISLELHNPFSPYKYFVICDGNEIIGYTDYKIFGSVNTAFLNIISVSNKYKGKGIGKHLLQYTKDFFTDKGFVAIELDVYKSNETALSYYDKFGFTKTGSKGFYKINADSFTSEKVVNIVNYPQYMVMMETYGFYFIDITINCISVRLGAIANDIIVRGEYDLQLSNTIKMISDTLGADKIYLISDNCDSQDAVLQDVIYRLQLKLK